MTRFEFQQELRNRNFEPADFHSNGHQLWKAPNGRFVWVTNLKGTYSFEYLDEIILSAHRIVPKPENSN